MLRATKGRWAVDNDCFNRAFVLSEYLEWLVKLQPWLERCLFAPVDDVVGNWPRTLARFGAHSGLVRDLGYPVAIVLQDGATVASVPWDEVSAVFVGGSTEWKLSQGVLELLAEAGRRDKWRHVGRVNSRVRISHFWGLADSFDGTFVCKSPDRALRRLGVHLRALDRQLRLL